MKALFGLSIIVSMIIGCWEKTRIKKHIKPSPVTDELSTDETQNHNAPNDWIAFDEHIQPDTINNTPDQNLEIDDIPTFDEAIEMDIVNDSQNVARRRVSSRFSMKSDELPDYENYESHPVYSP